jgi:hypothetical protein
LGQSEAGTIQALHPVSYRWIDRPEDGIRLGLVAQEVLDVVPDVVVVADNPDDRWGCAIPNWSRS